MLRRASRKFTKSLPPSSYEEPAVLAESCATLQTEETEEDVNIDAEGVRQGYEAEKAELRRQVHAEAMAYRITNSYLMKARLEEPVDEHTVLREQLRALECAERNGALLMPDELMFPERMFPCEEENVTLFGAPAGGSQLIPISTAVSTTGIRLLPTIHVYPSAEVRPAYSGAIPHPFPPLQSSPVFSAIAAATAQQLAPLGTATVIGRRRRAKGETRRDELFVPVPSSIVSAVPAAEARVPRSRLFTLQKHLWKFTIRTKPPQLRDLTLQQTERQKGFESTLRGGELAAAFESIRPGASIQAASAKSRAPQQGRGIAFDVDAAVSSSPAPSAVPFYSVRDRDLRPSVHSLYSADTVAAAEELEHLWRDAPVGAEATGTVSRVQLTSSVGGEKHVLNWREWLQRQRERGLYFTEGIYLLTVLGALNSSRCMGSLWYQLHIWETPYFFIGYAVLFLLAGLPLVHTEMLLGNLYRGNVVKCFTQINPHFAGLGLAITFSNFLRLTTRCAFASHFLLYFLASWQSPMPWELTPQDEVSCNMYQTEKECNAAYFGYLCAYSERFDRCIPCPTGKAAHHFLSTLEPYLIGKGDKPGGMDVQYLCSLTLVCLLVLGHTWRGFFRLGFTSAILAFVGFLLWGTLVAVCVVGKPARAGFMATARLASEVRGGFKWENLGTIISASYTDVLADLCIGCGVYQALSSYTKIGYNIVPGGSYVAFIQAGISAAAFVAILGVLRSVQVFSMFLYGGAFLLDTQMVAILFQTFIAVFQESRVGGSRYNCLMTIGLMLLVFLFSVCICINAQFTASAFVFAVSARIILPIVVLLESLVVGWYLNYKHQVRIAGGKATLIYVISCSVTLVTVSIVGAGTKNDLSPVILGFPTLNALYAATIAFFIQPKPASARSFSARFYALFLGNLDVFVKEVQRTTLYKGRFSWNFINWIASLLRGIFWCRPCATPSFCFRVSLVWASCMKHLVPVLCAHAIVNAGRASPLAWTLILVSVLLNCPLSVHKIVLCVAVLEAAYCSSVSRIILLPLIAFISFVAFVGLGPPWTALRVGHCYIGVARLSYTYKVPRLGPGMQALGLIVMSFGLFLTIVFPLVPRVGRWVCPPPEDYMPVKLFPSHPRPRVKTRSLAQRAKNIVLEFLWPEEKHSPFLSNFLLTIQKDQSLVQWESLRSRLNPVAETSTFSASVSAALPGEVRRRRSFVALDAAQAAAARRRVLTVPFVPDASDREGGGRQRGEYGRKEDTRAAEREGDVGAAGLAPATAEEVAADAVPVATVGPTTVIADKKETRAALAEERVEAGILPGFPTSDVARVGQPAAQISATTTSAAAKAPAQHQQVTVQREKQTSAGEAREESRGDETTNSRLQAGERPEHGLKVPLQDRQVISAQLASGSAAVAAAQATGDASSYMFEGYGQETELNAEGRAQTVPYYESGEDEREAEHGDGMPRTSFFLQRSQTLSSVQSI